MVKEATFGSKLVALRICKYLIVALRYKLRMFVVTLEGPVYILCDNRGVMKNMIILEPVLHKKNNAFNHNSVSEAVAEYILRIGKEYGENNLADLLTEVMTGQKQWDLCYPIFY